MRPAPAVRRPLAPALLLLAALVAAVVLLAMSAGARWVSPLQWLPMDGSIDAALAWTWRAPRIAAAFFVGACLATSGLIFQGVFRNPLAEPYLLGSAAGAGVGAALALLLPDRVPPALSLPLLAFAGAWAASLVVLAIGRLGGAWSSARLLLAGVAIAAILSALRSLLVMLFGDESTNLRAIVSWQLGGIQTPSIAEAAGFAAILLVLMLAAHRLAFGLDALGLGDEVARTMGIDTSRFVAAAIVVAAMATAFAVAWGGLIGFVGLIVPHVMRWWLGPLHGRLVGACVLGGGALLVLADTVARTAIAPGEIPVGLLTALVGGPFFIALLLLRRAAAAT